MKRFMLIYPDTSEGLGWTWKTHGLYPTQEVAERAAAAFRGLRVYRITAVDDVTVLVDPKQCPRCQGACIIDGEEVMFPGTCPKCFGLGTI